MLMTAHTAELTAGTLEAVHGLLAGAFGDELTPEDVEHALGGVHALVREGDDVVAHGAVVQRRLLHGGRALRCGYVEAVVVRADRRRRGHGTAVMRALQRFVEGAYDLGALGATDEGAALYERLGWRRWPGPTAAITPRGLERTPDDDGGVWVLAPPALALDWTAELACDWRDGDVW